MSATTPRSLSGRSGSTGNGRTRNRDRLTIALFVGLPTILVVGLVWLPAVATVVLSFANWEGLGGLDTIRWIGTRNYHDIATIYPPFWPAIRHNVIWLVFLFVVPTLLGVLLAVILDRNMRGSRVLPNSVLPASGALAGIGRLHLAIVLLP